MIHKEAIQKLEKSVGIQLKRDDLGDMQAYKESLEILKAEQPNCEGCEFFKHSNKDEHCYRYTEEPSLCKLREPIEQPPASEYPDSEFTKVQRKAAQLAADAYEEDQEWCPTKTARLLEACDRLDVSEASRKELVEALESYVDDEPCSFDHHGDCQTHYGSPCRNEKAIAEIKENK